MFRVLLAAACLVLFAATAQAGGPDDLKAANAAAEQGKVDEAIRLFTPGARSERSFARRSSSRPARAAAANTPPKA